jgi:hypothetical protein
MKSDDRPVIAALLVVAFCGLVLAASDAIKEPAELNWDTVGTLVIAAFTVVLALSTILLWWTTKADGKQRDRAFRTSERAYVKMSHAPPGLRKVEDQPGIYVIEVVVSNFGRTPAIVTDALIKKLPLPFGQKLDPEPNYTPDPGEHVPPQAFLVKDDHFSFHRRWVIGTGVERPAPKQDPAIEFYALGYVDYTDSFGKRYRAGYARRYKSDRNIPDPEVYPTEEAYHRRSNLMIVGGERYNYDRCLDDPD